ncbi:MAG TPA: hypothetical protein VGL94_08840, partial [Ktedonobacteraceae bacterium]
LSQAFSSHASSFLFSPKDGTPAIKSHDLPIVSLWSTSPVLVPWLPPPPLPSPTRHSRGPE